MLNICSFIVGIEPPDVESGNCKIPGFPTSHCHSILERRLHKWYSLDPLVRLYKQSAVIVPKKNL